MIASLSGRLRRKSEDRLVLDVNGVGYEVFVPPIAMRELADLKAAEGEAAGTLSLVTYYHATRDQPRPVLIGFTSELDREFFERLITVKDMGPMVAARALSSPVGEIAAAIIRQDEKYLRSLPGIGPQKAKNIVAQLQNKVAKFALAREGGRSEEPVSAGAPAAVVPPDADGLRDLVFEVLVKQLGHRPSEASQLIGDAFKRRPGIASPEELFDEIYRGGGATVQA
ncbi:MAG: Holliday junction DNA helicase RuvA [Candidatus Rokubacteria bacterium]|nr:Holliday junction DNA helicase RuvA [Candidatus Rokubacteria bacterium]MBI3824789.1 Holliday junction DNA helicase RuvA [Candidatus Rokubacteria bacterium]